MGYNPKLWGSEGWYFIHYVALNYPVNPTEKDKLKTSQIIKDTKALFIDPKRASQKDIARIKQLEKLASKRQNGSSEVKPTNLLREGEVPFSTDGNRLVFAPSSSKPRFPTSNDLIQ